jgi:hypothetical protein
MTLSGERRYRIIVAGGSARTLLDAIAGIELESCEAGWMCFVVSVRDESEFYGLLGKFEDLALHIVSIEELGGSVIPRPGMKPGDVA